MPSSRAVRPESALYAPIKALLGQQGYAVKGEVQGCDAVGVRGNEPPVIVELKRTFGLAVVLQGVSRLAMTDAVYLGVGAWPNHWREVRKLLRRLGLGLIVVEHDRAEIALDPAPYAPRKNRRKTTRLLGEHARREGDPNLGGQAMRRPLMTAYRQQALRCATHLAGHGPAKVADVRTAADAPKAGAILRDDVYGWFERAGRGVYTLTPAGRSALRDAPARPFPST